MKVFNPTEVYLHIQALLQHPIAAASSKGKPKTCSLQTILFEQEQIKKLITKFSFSLLSHGLLQKNGS